MKVLYNAIGIQMPGSKFLYTIRGRLQKGGIFVRLLKCYKGAVLRGVKKNSGKQNIRFSLSVVLFLAVCVFIQNIPAFTYSVSAEDSDNKIILHFDTASDEINTYQVLISETIYSKGERTTNLYREDYKIQKTAIEDGKTLQAIVCVGSVASVGGEIRALNPSGYYLTVDRTGRIIETEGVKPWDGRRLETIWLTQPLFPEYPVGVGDTWTMNDSFFSITSGEKIPEKRAYRFLGMEKANSSIIYKIGYEIVGKGKDELQEYTYISTGSFHLLSGNVIKLDASEILTYIGSPEDSNIITMVQINIVD